jgi:hypothetical protein
MYFRIFQDAIRGWRWHLRAANHRIIADSAEAYVLKQDSTSFEVGRETRRFTSSCQRRLKMSQKRRLKMSHPPRE